MFYDFSTSCVINSGHKSVNQWRTTCLSILLDTADTTSPLVLSAECVNEYVPFDHNLADRRLFIPHKEYPFYTFSQGSNWYMCRTISAPHIIPYNNFERLYLPKSSAISRFTDIRLSTCDLSFNDEILAFHDYSCVFPSFCGEKSVIKLIDHSTPTFHSTASMPTFLEDVQNAIRSSIPLNCKFLLPGIRSQILSPVRYINFAENYLQIISGKVAFAPQLAGRYCIALNISSGAALLEFLIDGYSFANINQEPMLQYNPQIYTSSLSLESLSLYSV